MSKMKKNIVKIIIACLFCILTSCHPLTNQTVSVLTITPKATETRTPIPTLVPSVTPVPSVTQLPDNILGDIFISKYTGSEIRQVSYLRSQNGNTLSSFSSEISTKCKHSGEYGMSFRYSIISNSPRSEFGWWSIDSSIVVDSRPIIDIQDFNALQFWVKGKTGGEIFNIIIQHEFGGEPTVISNDYVTVSSTEWRLAHIPLSDFWDNENISKIWAVGFLFYPSSGTGSICIDDITFIE